MHTPTSEKAKASKVSRPLTQLAIVNAKPKEKPYKLSDQQGLYLYITPAGGKSWRLKYRYLGKEKLLVLGSFPEVTLAEAREKQFMARKALTNGQDPGEEKQKKQQNALEAAERTFEKCAEEWWERKKYGNDERYTSYIVRRIQKDLIPCFGKKPIHLVTSRDLIDALQKVEARGAHELARRLKQYASEIFRQARAMGYISGNPAEEFESRDVLVKYKKGHFAAIEADEIPALLAALELNKPRLYRQTVLAVKLMLMTFVRTGELIKAQWEEFDLEKAMWSIPAERMKMRRPHLVPLSSQAVEALRELQAMNNGKGYVFPGVYDPKKHMSDNTILQALAALGFKGKMTGHGFRALAMSTIKEKLNYRHEVVDLQLAHAKKDKIQAAYDRAQFLEERIKMMQAWADYLSEQLNKAKD